MISKEAVEEFKNKKLNSWGFIKDYTIEDVSKLVDISLLKTKPYAHQATSLLAGLYNKNFLYFLDMGLGKTKIILDILILDKKWNRTLILSPNAVTVSTWTDEVMKHSNLSSVELMGTTEERWKMIGSLNDTKLCLLNYTGLLVMLTDNISGKWHINYNKLHEFRSYFDAIVFDEIHLAKNHMSLTFRICKELSKTMELRYGLTGTPVNRDPLSLWSQFYLIDRGETLGQNISLYRDAYFKARKSYWHEGIEYTFNKQYEAELNLRLSNKSLRYSEKEALDLPEITFIKLPILLSKDQNEYYELLKNDVGTTMPTVQNSFIKLRQISSGFLNIDGNDVQFDDNPKLEELLSLIESSPEESKIVVFLDFIKSGDIVCRALEKNKIKFERLYGGTKDKIDTKNRFLNDKKCKVFVANIRSGGTSLNLQVANYVVFYELPYSNIDYMQALKRVHRIGQDKKVFVYSLVVKNSIEEKIEKYLKEGKDIFKAIIEGKEKL